MISSSGVIHSILHRNYVYFTEAAHVHSMPPAHWRFGATGSLAYRLRKKRISFDQRLRAAVARLKTLCIM